ncbi:MAG: hypothetical protein GYB31_01710 [Bacteroidetes bacterium]|nr:hypothetical protein [Bacteroidota bacterium]
MNLKPTYLLLIFLIIAFSLPSCTNDPGGTKLGTIQCKVDGKKFKTKVGSATIGDISSGSGFFSIQGFEDLIPIGSDYVQIFSGIEDDQYSLEEIMYGTTNTIDSMYCDPYPDICFGMVFRDGDSQEEFSSGEVGGAFEITFEKMIFEQGENINGTFSGRLISSDSGEEIEVTDGVFNLEIL